MAKPPIPRSGGGIFYDNNVFQGRNAFPAGLDFANGGSIEQNYIILPDCPDDPSTMEFGAMCKNPTTGKINIKDASGLREL